MEQNNSADLLLVIDMQNVYTKGQEWACEGVEAASASILRLLNSRMPEQVIFTRYLAAEHPEGVWKEYNEMNTAVNADAWLNDAGISALGKNTPGIHKKRLFLVCCP